MPLARALTALGVRLDGAASTACAPDAAAYALARRHPGAATLPARPLLARQAAQAAAGALLELTAVLRRECPWDRAQTATSIVPHTVEEAYEVADAVRDAGLSPKLLDELGDLLFQTTFLALLCEEAEAGSWLDVALGVAAKLRLRHPWVFGTESAESAGDARNLWEDVKVESERREGIFHDVPPALPALLEARKVQRRAAAIGFEYADRRGVPSAISRASWRELRAELAGDRARARARAAQRGRRRARRRPLRVRQRRAPAQLRSRARAARRDRPLPRAGRARGAPRGCRGRGLPDGGDAAAGALLSSRQAFSQRKPVSK